MEFLHTTPEDVPEALVLGHASFPAHTPVRDMPMPSQAQDLERRVKELEARVTFLEDSIHQLIMSNIARLQP